MPGGSFELGLLYDLGKGVAQDYAGGGEVVSQRRADQGDATAQVNLGVSAWSLGKGVAQDYAEAVKWHRKAADQGNATAQVNLGRMYGTGRGVPQDYKEAVKWFRKAAHEGNAEGQRDLGEQYEVGHGVAQDYVRAHMWLNLAAASPSDATGKEATDDRNNIAAKMTPAQIERAQEMAHDCQLSNYANCGEPEDNSITTVTPPPAKTASADTSGPPPLSANLVPMQKDGETYVVPVLINTSITLKFVVDSGASDVTIPSDVVTTLMRMGALMESDFLDTKTYVLADGSKVPSRTFRIRSLKVGDTVVENVTGSVAPAQGSLLLGQSFLGHFKSWSIDNTKHALVLE